MPTATQYLSATYLPPTPAAAQPLYLVSLVALGFLVRPLGSWSSKAPTGRIISWPLLLLFGGAGYAPLPTFLAP